MFQSPFKSLWCKEYRHKEYSFVVKIKIKTCYIWSKIEKERERERIFTYLLSFLNLECCYNHFHHDSH